MNIKINGEEYPIDNNQLTVRDVLIKAGKPELELHYYELIRVRNNSKDVLYSISKKPAATLDDIVYVEPQDAFTTEVVFFTIIVNTVKKRWPYDKISYKDLIECAFGSYDDNPNIAYTVVYFNGIHNEEGFLVKGKNIKIQNEMVFTITRTDKS